MRSGTISLMLIILSLLVASLATAQAPSDFGIGVVGGSVGLPGPATKTAMVTMHVDNMDAEPVKGAPFCATIATDHTQVFADGNRIHTTDNSTLCRDSQGRLRREAGLNLLGAAPQNSAPKLITIVDPVAGFRYMLDSDNKVAHRFSLAPPSDAGSASAGHRPPGKDERVVIYQRVGNAGPEMSVRDNVFFKTVGQSSDEPAPTTENLGDQDIDGIHATGTRVTTTIPAGKMGNEQPMLVTSERWYSTDLKATVMTKHDDPWAGELKTQFKGVNTSEPDPALFRVPADYRVVDEKAGPFVVQRRSLEPLPPPQ